VWYAKALLKEGVAWRIGNGTNINIWENAWLIDLEGKYVAMPRPTDDAIRSVSELIDHETTTCKMESIDQIFNKSDKQIIVSIALSLRLPKDR